LFQGAVLILGETQRKRSQGLPFVAAPMTALLSGFVLIMTYHSSENIFDWPTFLNLSFGGLKTRDAMHLFLRPIIFITGA
jgi:hypothetical protein